jgi:hypothetical protein
MAGFSVWETLKWIVVVRLRPATKPYEGKSGEGWTNAEKSCPERENPKKATRLVLA